MAPALFGDIKKKEEARDLNPSNGRSGRNLCATSRRDCPSPSTPLSPLSLEEPNVCTCTLLLYYCSRRDISVSESRLDIHVMLRCQHGRVWLGSSLKCSWIPLSLSLSLWRMLRVAEDVWWFYGRGDLVWWGWLEGEEEGGGVVLRRGYTKGVMDAFERKSFWLSKFASNGNVNKKFRGNRSIPSSSGKLWEIKIEFFWKSFLFKNANNSVEEFYGSDRWNSRGLVLRGFVNWERCDDW